jgi:protein subunit release factor B
MSNSSPDLPEDPLLARMRRLGVRPEDLEERFARSSGPGGQNVNKVSTAVTLRHHPTGISVTVQDSRSQSWNRRLARERLLDAIETARREARAAARAEREKERRRNAPRPRGVKKRMVEGKRHRAEIKRGRRATDD